MRRPPLVSNPTAHLPARAAHREAHTLRGRRSRHSVDTSSSTVDFNTLISDAGGWDYLEGGYSLAEISGSNGDVGSGLLVYAMDYIILP